MILNHVSSNVLSGLIETLAGHHTTGTPICPFSQATCNWKPTRYFTSEEALQLLRFAQLSEGDLMLTDAGKHFAHLETDARKSCSPNIWSNYVPVMGLIRRVLDERPSHTAPARASATNLRTTCRRTTPTKR